MTDEPLPFDEESTPADTERAQRIKDKIQATRDKLREMSERHNNPDSTDDPEETRPEPTVDQETRGYPLSPSEVRRQQRLGRAKEARAELDKTPRWQPPAPPVTASNNPPAPPPPPQP